MGIHVHVKGKPDMCRCCAIVDRLNELWDRTHNSVLSVNGVYPDGNGNVFIQGIQDITDIREAVNDLDDDVTVLEERITTDRMYLEAVAEDVAEIGSSYVTLSTEQTISGLKTFTAQTISLGDRPSKAFKSRYITRGQLPVNEADCTIDEYDSEGNRMAFINMGQNVTGDGFMVLLAADYQGNGDRAVLRTNRMNDNTASSYLEVPYKGKPSSSAAVPLSFVSASGSGKANNLLHDTGDEAKAGSLELNNGSLYADSPTAWTGSANFDGKGIAFRDSGNNTLIALFPRVTNGRCKLMYAQKVASGNIEYHELIS